MLILIEIPLLPHINIIVGQDNVATIKCNDIRLSSNQVEYVHELIERVKTEVNDLLQYDSTPEIHASDDEMLTSDQVRDNLNKIYEEQQRRKKHE
jgi:hypothetical protein